MKTQVPNSSPQRNIASGVDRRMRRLRLLDRLYGQDYKRYPIDHSRARRNAIAKGLGVPSLAELLTGAGFYKDDYKQDLARFCRIVLKYERVLCRYLNVEGGDRSTPPSDYGLKDFLDELENASCSVQHDSASRIYDALQTVKFQTEYNLYRETFDWPEFVFRLDFYLACADDQPAQARMAHLCLDAVKNGMVRGAELRALRCALAWLDLSGAKSNISDCQDDFLSGEEMVVSGGVIFSSLGQKVSIEKLAALFVVNDAELIGLVERLRAVDGSSSNGVDAIDKNKRNEAEVCGIPSLVVFNAVNSRDTVGKIYKELIEKPLPLVQPPDLAEARTQLLAEFSQAKNVIDVLLRDVANRRDNSGRPIIRIKPTVIVGEPGAGKSKFVRRFGEVMRLPQLFFGCAAVNDSMFGATNKKWSNTEPALPVERIAIEKVANLLVILDEIDKSGTRRDYGRLQDVVLAMVEPSTATEYFDQSLSATVNLSALNWICTANVASDISAPLRDRFQVLTFPTPGVEHLPALLPSILQELSRDRYGNEHWTESLDSFELSRIADAWRGGSIRILRRLVEATLDAREEYQRTMMN